MTMVSALGRFVRQPGPARGVEGEACELCSAPVADGHAHVVDLQRRSLLCVCAACAILFRQPAGAPRFQTVPDRVLIDPGFALSEADWSALEIPVRLAFLFFSSPARRWIAVYPGPAGAIESALPLEAWARVAERTRLVAAARPDVEALLVRGASPAAAAGDAGRSLEALLVPIDRCYALAGRLRRAWRGFEGGAEARRELDGFFAELRRRASRLAPDGGRDGP